MIKMKESKHSEEVKNEARTEYKVHKLWENKLNIDIIFDMQQNQPLPKVSIGEAFYLRQAWLYNLCDMMDGKPLDNSKVFFHTQLETEAGRGANAVASGLKDYLEHLGNNLREAGTSDKIPR